MDIFGGARELLPKSQILGLYCYNLPRQAYFCHKLDRKNALLAFHKELNISVNKVLTREALTSEERFGMTTGKQLYKWRAV